MFNKYETKKEQRLKKRRYGKLAPRVRTISPAHSNIDSSMSRVSRLGWGRVRSSQLRREPLCRHCKRKNLVRAAQEVDHIIPIEAGGGDEDSNLQSLCIPCHVVKSTEDAAMRAEGLTREERISRIKRNELMERASTKRNDMSGGSDSWK